MQYISTRNSNEKILSAVAIMTGLSSDGGLFVPCGTIPQIDMTHLLSLSDYNSRAKYVLSMYLTDYSKDEISDCVDKAYTAEKFGSANGVSSASSTPKVAPIRKLDDSRYVLELWHGPTCAFKDIALQILPQFMTVAMKKLQSSKETLILVATSGDTGKAALEGFCNVPNIKICVFYPDSGVSDIQKLQMITQDGNNVRVAGIRGNFDDAQNGVKQIFTDEAYKSMLEKDKGCLLSSANSINWGRLVPQIVYYISAYCDMVNNGYIVSGEKINICVPTGNFGNILAAYYAMEMGIPVNKLICASNMNNILTDFFSSGIYDINRKFHATISPSMDILISSNLERLIHAICGADAVRSNIEQLSSTGKYSLDENVISKLASFIFADFCNEENTKLQIKKTFNEMNYLIDTHTAVAMNVYDKYSAKTGDNTKTIIASTASPYKFGESVLSALGRERGSLSDFELLDVLSDITKTEIPTALSDLKGKPIRFNSVCDKDNLKHELENLL